MNVRMFTGLVLVCAMGSTGCKALAKRVTKEVAQEVQQAASPAADEERVAMGQYAEGFNTLIDTPQKVIKEYFDDIPADGPEPDKKYRLFGAHTRAAIELKKAKTSIEAATRSAPDSLKHIAPLANAAVADLEGAVKTFEEAHKYYDAEDFKDDEGKKGKELHQRMLKAAEAVRKSLGKFSDALSAVEERQNQEELKQFEGDKGYSYWFRLFTFEANKLLKPKDETEFEKAFPTLDKHYQDLKNFSDSKGDGAHAAFKAYMSQADRFHSTAKKLSRAWAEAEPKEQDINRLQSQLVSSYNALISTGNGLRQLEANNLLK